MFTSNTMRVIQKHIHTKSTTSNVKIKNVSLVKWGVANVENAFVNTNGACIFRHLSMVYVYRISKFESGTSLTVSNTII